MAAQRGKAEGQGAKGGFLVGLSNDLAEAVERAGQYVVRVNARRRLPGSGIVWSADGVVVTADHVVEAEEGITVGLPDGREVPARIVGRDPGTDLAVLRAEAAGLTPPETAEPKMVKVGNLVLAIGRPGAAAPMAAIGIISAWTGPWRTWRGGSLDSLIQSDMTLYPGFSGGPLVDAEGRMVGLNSSILTRGVSAAIPAETVQRVVGAIVTRGRVRRGYLGVTSQPVAIPDALAQRVGLHQETGLMVVGVEPGGPADLGGLMLGDVVVGMSGRPIRDVDDLQAQLGPDQVGASMAVEILRGGERRELNVTVGERR